MKNKIERVFIAGGTGFIGYYSALEFISKGIAVDTIALPNEINLSGWYPLDKIGLSTGNLFEMTNTQIEAMFSQHKYDALIYAMGPDDRVIPKAPAYDFFYDKLVTQCKRICNCARNVGIHRCVITGSYFSHFDNLSNGALSLAHPYIKARIAQENELSFLGNDSKFEIMFLELPYVFGVMPNRKPLWREHFIARFDKLNNIYFPCGGGTAVLDISGVAEAVVATTYNGENNAKYLIGNVNMTFKNLIETMLKDISTTRKYVGLPPFICALGATAITRAERAKGLQSGLDYPKLMTQILSKKFYIDTAPVGIALCYDEFGYTGGKDVMQSISETMRKCYE
ncbi:MAG: NAD(P)-dependent oxidoreductase [Clostridia bacterium]